MISDLPVTSEAALLFRCAAGRPDPTAIQAHAASRIDWRAFAALAESHHLTSLCFRRLSVACADQVPPNILDSMRQHFRRNVERNLYLTGELCRLLKQLEDRGVPALAFKGPVLAWWLYDHPGLREFQDLDVLVEQSHVPRAQEVLKELGYDTGKTKVVPAEGQLSLLREEPPAMVDLHWELAPRSMGLSLNARSVFPRSMTVPIAGRPVMTFGAEDQLLLCALHGGKHGWTNLSWLADLSALIETRPPDWAHLLAEARRKCLTRALLVGVRLAHDLLDTALPIELSRALDRDPGSAILAREAEEFLLGRPNVPLFPRELRFELELTEGWSRKVHFLWTKISEPSSEDWEARRSGRPFRLMKKYAYRLARAREA